MPTINQPSNLKKRVHAALSNWHQENEQFNGFDNLQLYCQRVLDAPKDEEPRTTLNKLLQSGIDQLATRDPQKADILQRRFCDNETITHVRIELGLLNDDLVNRRQRIGIKKLSDILWEWELDTREQVALTLEGELSKPTYTQLFGFDALHEEIVNELVDPEGATVVTITGIGGIGKTSLCDSITRAIIRHFCFEKVIWLRVDPTAISGEAITPEIVLDVLSAELLRKLYPDLTESLLRDQRMQRIRKRLRSSPYLVVIDNIETNADTGILLQHLSDWSQPSKFLVTTRTRLTGQTAALSYHLTELPRDDAVKLVADQAYRTGLREFSADVEKLMDDIYAVTGGNPLALKLVVHLVSFMSLPHVLANLREGGSTDDVAEMYTRIYRQSWLTLKQDVRQLLIAMPLVGEQGGRIEQLIAMSELGKGDIWSAVNDLVNRSLIEVRGSYEARVYGVHRLTMTFLETDIIGGEWGFE